MMTRAWLGLVFASIWAILATGASAQGLEPGAAYRVTAPLATAAGGEAHDISGIACVPAEGNADTRHCLVVNDEGSSAQRVILGAGSLAADGKPISLLGDEPSDATLGVTPDVETCRKKKPKFDELDGEGVAYAAPYYYVVGSHGCSRRKGKFELSAFVLARMDAGDSTKIATTYRLADALREARGLAAYFGRSLADENGLNIEGVAVVGDRLYAGLRAPSLDGQAFLVGVSVEALFAPGHAPLKVAPQVVALKLGPGAGIRDLAPLPDGHLLVLSGPAQEQTDVPYGLVVVDPATGAIVKTLGALAPLPADETRGKPEAVLPLGSDRVLVLYDSLPSGAPREYRVKLN